MAQSATADEKTQDTPETTETTAQSAAFSEVAETDGSGQAAGIDILLDMEVPVTVVIGQTEIPIERLLQLSPGAVLKLDKPIDMPADLYLKDRKFATGTIVVLEDRFAVRIQEILTDATAD